LGVADCQCIIENTLNYLCKHNEGWSRRAVQNNWKAAAAGKTLRKMAKIAEKMVDLKRGRCEVQWRGSHICMHSQWLLRFQFQSPQSRFRPHEKSIYIMQITPKTSRKDMHLNGRKSQ